jgi:hypothetical protein
LSFVLQINCDLDVVDQSALSVVHHGMNLAMNSSSSSSQLSYGQLDSAQTSSYYNRPDNNLANNYGTNLVRDVAFSSGTELESCVNMGSYTNFYNARQHQNLDNFETIQPQQPTREEQSFDMYSTFNREDSYSENSDEFSNESGDQRLVRVFFNFLK